MFIKYAFPLVALLMPIVSTAQNCQPNNIPSTTPTSQFTDNNNGTITDKKTGLMWKKCSEGQTWNSVSGGCDGNVNNNNWQLALKQAQATNTSGGFAGYKDWRTPNINELSSIVERACDRPSINLTVFPNTPDYGYAWSSSTWALDQANAWCVDFSGGETNPPSKSYNDTYVRLVRGG